MEDFASSAPDILRAEHICKAFADKQVLRDVNVRLAPGELVCILGVSGVGKTTLFNILSGLLPPDSGDVLLLLLKGMKKADARREALRYFDRFGLAGCQQKYPVQLSGGMRQRAALLRTWLCGNRVALLDEPFSALDTLTRTAVQEWYLQVMEEIRMSTLFITHDVDEAILLSDRIYIMKGSPAAMTDELRIPTPRPRDRDYMLSEEVLALKRQIRELIG